MPYTIHNTTYGTGSGWVWKKFEDLHFDANAVFSIWLVHLIPCHSSKGGSSPPFKAPTLWPSLPSLFKIFVSPPLFCSTPFSGILDSFHHPHTIPSHLNPTNNISEDKDEDADVWYLLSFAMQTVSCLLSDIFSTG